MTLGKKDYIFLSMVLSAAAILIGVLVSKYQYKPVQFSSAAIHNKNLQMFLMKDFFGANSVWQQITFKNGRLEQSDLGGITVENATFENLDINFVNFTKAKFKNCVFRNIDFKDVIFNYAQFSDVQFEKINCDGCDFRNVHMQNVIMDGEFSDTYYNEKSLLPLKWNHLEAKGFKYRQ